MTSAYTSKITHHTAQLSQHLEREAVILKDLLANFREEQMMLLEGKTEGVQRVMTLRDPILETLLECRQKRLETLAVLDSCGFEQSSWPEEVISRKEEVCSLVETLQKYASNNNALIKNRIELTQQMIRRLFPQKNRDTYNAAGTLGRGPQRSVAVLSKEG